ncbi:hypothetical protein EI94DRAFT_1806052 [Lactarius quietus]|nr:hypothetical protein EI94DRAFT_1806052 [Lactarius quietus]
MHKLHSDPAIAQRGWVLAQQFLALRKAPRADLGDDASAQSANAHYARRVITDLPRLRLSSRPLMAHMSRDLLVLEIGPLSALDARSVEWLAEEYVCAGGARVCVRRGWRDLLGEHAGAAVDRSS